MEKPRRRAPSSSSRQVTCIRRNKSFFEMLSPEEKLFIWLFSQNIGLQTFIKLADFWKNSEKLSFFPVLRKWSFGQNA